MPKYLCIDDILYYPLFVFFRKRALQQVIWYCAHEL